MIEDFFRLSSDAVRYYPQPCITSSLAPPIFSAALSALALQQREPILATLHYYHDLLSFGFEMPAVSEFTGAEGEAYRNPTEIQQAVRQLVVSQGQLLTQRLLAGMMFTFPLDCVPDASGILMTLFDLMPQEAGIWIESTLRMAPAGTIKAGEAERLMKGISDKIGSGEIGRIRAVLQGMFSFWESEPVGTLFSLFFSLSDRSC